MLRRSVALLALLCLAGCAPAAVSSPGAPSPTAPVVSPSAPPASPTAAAPTTSPCPTDSPMSVAEYTAADPSCFGSNDVTLTGWEDIPSGVGSPEGDSHTSPQWLVENEPTPSVLVDKLPGECDQDMCDPFLFVHVDPASKLRFERDGVYVVITGHRHDPAAKGCTRISSASPAPSPIAGSGAADCENSFVLTSVHEVDPPASLAALCPTDAVLTPSTFTADPACFHGKTLKLIGWTDGVPAIDFMGPTIAPAWIVPPGSAIWSQKPVTTDGDLGCPQDAVSCAWIFVQVKPGSGISIPNHQWVILTGHIDDPAAETCHYTDGGPFGGGIPPAVFARQSCRSSFVVTKVEVTTAPG